jgi:hypothetical protein
MWRREFIMLLGGAVALPIAARGQQAGRLPTIGLLIPGTRAAHGPWFASLVQRLNELGWIEGRTVAIEYRWADGRIQRLGHQDRSGCHGFSPGEGSTGRAQQLRHISTSSPIPPRVVHGGPPSLEMTRAPLHGEKFAPCCGVPGGVGAGRYVSPLALPARQNPRFDALPDHRPRVQALHELVIGAT